ncbi:sucrose-6-phosphate hydrolase [Singulisphaera sp. GP187]|uniref:sucrose-6-phosphate hydrolase n=1 Tax=Singulisphaera sp. GP187 TaxID=1882752 RepID=UPI0011612C8C|nr:sucrose-6-phosphate hydrolase [Singulisphaera sp. GP187]
MSNLPLIAAGSGGSYTAAHFACALHGAHTRRMAQAMTPLQLVSAPTDLRDLGIFIPTAGGKNPDVLGTFRHLVSEEPRSLMIWCATQESPLASLAAKHRFVDLHEFVLPCGKDGFLAVNSLLAFSVLLARAYTASVGSSASSLPRSFDKLIGDRSWSRPDQIDNRCGGLWERETLIVLHGPSTLPAAVDIESKLTEAALGSVQLADYRHFAHGRHHWIAKRRTGSAVLAIICDDDRSIAESMLALIPPDVPIVRLDVPYAGWLAGLSAMARGFFLAASVGRSRGIDPGDPGVPSFGRDIYHLNVYKAPQDDDPLPREERLIIERKARVKVADLTRTARLDDWRQAYQAACSALYETVFCGLALDYDGTLCHESERFDPLPEVMAAEFARLLRGQVRIGIATGRGKSVRKSLQQALPEKLWDRVVIGYYNGAEIGMLGDDTCPDDADVAGPELKDVVDRLDRDPLISRLAKVTIRSKQITLEPAEGFFPGPLWEYVHSVLLGLAGNEAVALRSGHSVDIVPPQSSKLAVVEKVRQLAGSEHVLRIGDRGRWPGNDYALLDHAHALSADEVSPDPRGGWNIAPAGHRGAQATLGYIRRLKATRGGLRLGPMPLKRSGR